MATASASVATSFTPLHDRILVRRVKRANRFGVASSSLTPPRKAQEGGVVFVVGKGKSK